MKTKIVWLARDEILGYTLWIVEPYPVKFAATDKMMYMNSDYPGQNIFVKLQPIDMQIDNFPEISMNTLQKLEINSRKMSYYFGNE